jgi:hypothetical protein
VITIHLTYVVDPTKLDVFEDYARRWITLIDRLGGQHHGYFLPSEGASDVAYALYSFPSLAAYETYREASATDPGCLEANAVAHDAGCILRWDRTFLRPVTTAS